VDKLGGKSRAPAKSRWRCPVQEPGKPVPEPSGIRSQASIAVLAVNSILEMKRKRILTLIFPNFSRSYDTTGRRIRFWGHDTTMEVSLFIMDDALAKLDPKAGSGEGAMLATFDANRDRINATAANLHARDRQGFHVLEEGDF
jgi:hypothetical protein